MWKETVAQGIKRRMAERSADQRRRRALAVQISLWGGAIGFIMSMIGMAVTFLAHR